MNGLLEEVSDSTDLCSVCLGFPKKALTIATLCWTLGTPVIPKKGTRGTLGIPIIPKGSLRTGSKAADQGWARWGRAETGWFQWHGQ